MLTGSVVQFPNGQLVKGRANGSSDRHHSVLQFAIKCREHRQSHWDHRWEELAEFFHPDREGFIAEQHDGNERRDSVYGSISELSARALASHLATTLRPAGRTWFKAKAKDERLNASSAVRVWCDLVTRITYAHLYDARANFERQAAECDTDLVVFGTGVIRPGWNKAGGHLTFRSHHLKQVCLATDHTGSPDMIFIFWDLTLRQVAQMFPEDKLPDAIKDKLGQQNCNLEEKVEILNACLPNEDYKRYGAKGGRFPYASLWIAVKEKELIDEGGFHEFPYVTPRWQTFTGETYGRSPAMTALRDARLHDAMTRSFIDAAELAMMPPLQGPAQAVKGGIDLRSGGFTAYDLQGFGGNTSGRGPIQPIELGALPSQAFELLTKIEERIGAAFFRDILELPSMASKDITATEINARLDQYLRVAAPIFARLETYNAGIINRVFNILAREQQYPEAPPELQGKEVEFEYEGPMKQARDKAEALKIVEGLQLIGGVAQVVPTAIDNLDGDVTVRLLGHRADLPEVIFKDVTAMMQERAARAKQMEMAQMAEMAGKAGPALAHIANATSKAKEAGVIDTSSQFPVPATEFDPSQLIEDAAYEVVE